MNSEIAEILGEIMSAGEKKANIVTFATEDEGIEQAKRIAQLKPGDVFYSGIQDEAIQKFVYMGTADDGGRARAIGVDDGNLVTAKIAWGSIRFEPETDAA